MSHKPHPERVNGAMASLALTQEDKLINSWSRYIILHYRFTGNLAPGCDARDFYAWLEANEPEMYEAKKFKSKGKRT